MATLVPGFVGLKRSAALSYKILFTKGPPIFCSFTQSYRVPTEGPSAELIDPASGRVRSYKIFSIGKSASLPTALPPNDLQSQGGVSNPSLPLSMTLHPSFVFNFWPALSFKACICFFLQVIFPILVAARLVPLLSVFGGLCQGVKLRGAQPPLDKLRGVRSFSSSPGWQITLCFRSRRDLTTGGNGGCKLKI